MLLCKPYCIILLGELLAVTAGATPVTFFFTGQVNSEAINGCGALVNCGVVFGSYTFDSAAPDQNPNPTTGLYAATNITFSIDATSFFTSPDGVINVADFSLVDQYGVLATGTASNASTATLSILLADPTATAFGSDALPQNPTALNPLLPGTFQLNAADDTFQLLGSITSINVLPAGSGLVQVCKIGVAGVAVGTDFTFSVGGAPLVVPAGTCSNPVVESAGTLTITENLPAGVVLTAITTSPASARITGDLSGGTGTLAVTAAGLTTVYFTDALLVNTGSLQVCKDAGSGVPLGSAFGFNVAGTPITVAAGTCAPPVLEPAGPITISEALPAGITLTNVGTTPTGALVSSNPAAGSASVTVTAGSQTTVTFTNTLTPGSNIPAGPFLLRYASNLNIGDSYIDLSNAGTVSGATLDGANPSGSVCVSAYAFDPAEELISCCSCLVTPNALTSLSVQNDLLSSTLTPAKSTAVVIGLLASTPVGGTCNAATASATNLVFGVRAWGTSLHALPSAPATYGTAETPFSPTDLSVPELTHLTTYCQFIQSNGSGFGTCRSCQSGGR
jgi:hypothetical protein